MGVYAESGKLMFTSCMAGGCSLMRGWWVWPYEGPVEWACWSGHGILK